MTGSGAGGVIAAHEAGLAHPAAEDGALPVSFAGQVPTAWAGADGLVAAPHYLEVATKASARFVESVAGTEAAGHWVHGDTGHLAWNLTALLLLGSIVESSRRWLLPLGLLAGSIGVDLWLWTGLPGIVRYCGLSGALNTLLILALWTTWKRSGHWLVWAIGLGSLLKILVEMADGRALLTQTAWPSVPSAHLAGWLVGCLLVALNRWRPARPGWA